MSCQESLEQFKQLDSISIGNTVVFDPKKIWQYKGHVFGEGLISPNRKCFYINIPKNASSYMKEVLLSVGWTRGSIEECSQDPDFLVVLRDPIDRWYAGIAEYLLMYHTSVLDKFVYGETNAEYKLYGQELAIALLFERITFDDHTERQCMFLRGVPFEKTTFLQMDSDFKQNLQAFLDANNYRVEEHVLATALNEASSADQNVKYRIKEVLKKIAGGLDFRMQRLEEWFYCDRQLINQVQFYRKSNGS